MAITASSKKTTTDTSSGSDYPERPVLYKLGKNAKELVLRIAPNLSNDGEEIPWCKLHTQHFGYGLSIKKKDGTPVFVPQPFKCVKRYNNNSEVTQECPKCVQVYALRDEVKALEAKYANENKSKEEIAALLKSKKDWLFLHSIDKKYWMYAKNQDGKWGFFLMGKTLKVTFDACLNDLEKEGVAPLSSENGVWFRFKRVSEDGKNDTIVVDTITREDRSKVYRTDTMTDADFQQIEKLPLITKAVRVLNLDDVKTLVSSNGDTELATLIFNKGKENSTFTKKKVEVTESSPEPMPTPPQALGAGVPTPAPAVAPPSTVTLPAGMTPDDFLKMFKLQ
jgi:hypothetical protein